MVMVWVLESGVRGKSIKVGIYLSKGRALALCPNGDGLGIRVRRLGAKGHGLTLAKLEPLPSLSLSMV
jgi:hypothetical protein